MFLNIFKIKYTTKSASVSQCSPGNMPAQPCCKRADTIQGRLQDLAWGGAKNFFFQIWKFACPRVLPSCWCKLCADMPIKTEVMKL